MFIPFSTDDSATSRRIFGIRSDINLLAVLDPIFPTSVIHKLLNIMRSSDYKTVNGVSAHTS